MALTSPTAGTTVVTSAKGRSNFAPCCKLARAGVEVKTAGSGAISVDSYATRLRRLCLKNMHFAPRKKAILADGVLGVLGRCMRLAAVPWGLKPRCPLCQSVQSPGQKEGSASVALDLAARGFGDTASREQRYGIDLHLVHLRNGLPDGPDDCTRRQRLAALLRRGRYQCVVGLHRV